MLIPGYLRQKSRSARIAFFWHIPFPAAELVHTLPWRRALLESMLACDLSGFHISEYAENFIEAVVEVLDAIEQLLERTPALAGEITLVQIVMPARGNAEVYRQKKRENVKEV